MPDAALSCERRVEDALARRVVGRADLGSSARARTARRRSRIRPRACSAVGAGAGRAATSPRASCLRAPAHVVRAELAQRAADDRRARARRGGERAERARRRCASSSRLSFSRSARRRACRRVVESQLPGASAGARRFHTRGGMPGIARRRRAARASSSTRCTVGLSSRSSSTIVVEVVVEVAPALGQVALAHADEPAELDPLLPERLGLVGRQRRRRTRGEPSTNALASVAWTHA